MGGYGSGGHRWGRTRVTVESCFRFDAKMLRAFLNAAPGAHLSASWGWSDNRGETARARTDYRAGDSFFTLRVMRDGATEAQQIAISFSPCHFGGRRVWLHCPRCARRVFRLYLYTHFYAGEKRLNRFWCRACMCGGLSYYLRNTKERLRIGQERALRVKRKLGNTADLWDFLPDKPRGMRWRTYDRLAAQHKNAVALANDGFIAGALRKFPHLFADAFERGTKRGAA